MSRARFVECPHCGKLIPLGPIDQEELLDPEADTLDLKTEPEDTNGR